jgi:phage tail sheath protein FI
MPVTPTYPGVYVEEVPSGVRTITGVATSITAFIGRAKRGPVNESVTINSFADFERIFGGLWVDSPMSYAVRDFYLNGGSQAIVVRLFHPFFAEDADREAALQAAQAVKKAVDDAAEAIKEVAKACSAKAKEYQGKSVEEKKAADAVAKAAEDAAKLPDASPYSVSQSALKAAGTYDEGDPKAAAAEAVAKAPGRSASEKTSAVAAAADKAKAYTSEEMKKTASNLVAKATEDAAELSGATLDSVVKAAADAVGVAAPLTKARLTLNGVTLEAASEGSWGNSLRARVDHDVHLSDAARAFGLTADDLINLTVRDMSTGVTEQLRNVSVKEGPRRLDRVLINESNLVRLAGELPQKRPEANDAPLQAIVADKTVDPPKLGEIDAALQLQLEAGTTDDAKEEARKTAAAAELRKDPFRSNLRSVGVADLQASNGQGLVDKDYVGPGTADNKMGLYALEKADLFNLLCIPADIRDGDTPKEVYREAVKYCKDRRALLIVDPPAKWSANRDTAAKTARDGLTGLGLSSDAACNAALYFPRVVQADPLREGQLDTFVPCGIVAGIISRTDTQRGIWKAPAGLDAAVTGVQRLAANLTDAENGMLNPLGINCLRTFPVAGTVVWGARTLRGADQLADEYKYVPVRRLALYIEESLYRGTQWVVFEPNDEPLWAQIRLNVGAFMHNLFRQGAFQGRTPREAYFVKCDKGTTTQNDINLGIVNIVVGFAPLKPAEFVIISLQQMAGQIQT